MLIGAYVVRVLAWAPCAFRWACVVRSLYHSFAALFYTVALALSLKFPTFWTIQKFPTIRYVVLSLGHTQLFNIAKENGGPADQDRYAKSHVSQWLNSLHCRESGSWQVKAQQISVHKNCKVGLTNFQVNVVLSFEASDSDSIIKVAFLQPVRHYTTLIDVTPCDCILCTRPSQFSCKHWKDGCGLETRLHTIYWEILNGPNFRVLTPYLKNKTVKVWHARAADHTKWQNTKFTPKCFWSILWKFAPTKIPTIWYAITL